MPKSSLEIIAIIIGIIVGIIGLFGGVPGIIKLFFSKPSLSIDGFMPVIVFDKGYDLSSDKPKYSLKGLMKISNPNDYDISISEMKLYGRSKDSSGKYKFPGNKPILYELNIMGILDTKEDIIKAYGSTFQKYHFAHFDNTEEPGIMHGPMIAAGSPELGHPIFHIFTPSYNQLFKYNDRRVPYSLVDEVEKNELSFGLIFNNEIIKISHQSIFSLHHVQFIDWDNDNSLQNMYNAAKVINDKTK